MLIALYLLIGDILFISAYNTALANANNNDARWINKSGIFLVSLFFHVVLLWPLLLIWIGYDEIKAARNSSDIIGGDENGLY